MIVFPRRQGTRLAQVRGLDGGFPFYGRIETVPADADPRFRVEGGALVEESLRGSVARQDIVDDAMIDRYWELLRFPGNREATALRARIDREPAMADRIGESIGRDAALFQA